MDKICRGADISYDWIRIQTVLRSAVSKPVVSLSEFKARAAQLLVEMKTGGQTIVVTQNGTATAVVQDYESHQRIQDALLMLKLVVQGEADVSAGRMVSQRQVFADIKAGLTASDV